MLRACDILNGKAQRVKQRDVAVIPGPERSQQHLANGADNVLLPR